MLIMGDPPDGHLQNAFRFQSAGRAAVLAGIVSGRAVLADSGLRLAHSEPVFLHFFAGRASVFVRFRIKGEGRVREGTGTALYFVKDWDMRIEAEFTNQPTQHLPDP